MELTAEQVKEIGLSDEQVKKVVSVVSEYESTLKKTIDEEWKGRANEQAEGILTGAAEKVEQLTGIKREKGQKIADYIHQSSELFFKGQRSTLEKKQQELDEKIKNSGSDESTKKEYAELKEKFTELQKKEAIYSEYEKENYKEKYLEAKKTLSEQEQEIALNSVKPSFPATANAYEISGRWNEFKSDVLKKYDLKKDGEIWVGVDKENQFKVVKLSDLVSQNKELTELTKGRSITGIGGSPKTEIDIEGVPFKVPENATSQERQQLIKEYLTNVEKLAITSNDYAKRYAELNQKILQKTAK